jgi:hypothetical protein
LGSSRFWADATGRIQPAINRYTKDNTGTWMSLILARVGTTISVTFLLPAAEQAAPAVTPKARVA